MEFIEGTCKNYLTSFAHLHTVPLANLGEIYNVLVATRIALPENAGSITFN